MTISFCLYKCCQPPYRSVFRITLSLIGDVSSHCHQLKILISNSTPAPNTYSPLMDLRITLSLSLTLCLCHQLKSWPHQLPKIWILNPPQYTRIWLHCLFFCYSMYKTFIFSYEMSRDYIFLRTQQTRLYLQQEVSHIMCHVSCIMYHASCIMYHVPYII